MTTDCVVENCKEAALENYQFCKKHALEYPEIADMTQINFRKEAFGINEYRKALIKTSERYLVSNLNSVSTMIGLASAAAQIMATQTYSTGAKNQDILQYLFVKMFNEQYKISIAAIKNEFMKKREREREKMKK